MRMYQYLIGISAEGWAGGDAQVQRVRSLHEARPPGEHRGPGAAPAVDGAHEERRQQRPEGAVLVRHERPDEGG